MNAEGIIDFDSGYGWWRRDFFMSVSLLHPEGGGFRGKVWYQKLARREQGERELSVESGNAKAVLGPADVGSLEFRRKATEETVRRCRPTCLRTSGLVNWFSFINLHFFGGKFSRPHMQSDHIGQKFIFG